MVTPRGFDSLMKRFGIQSSEIVAVCDYAYTGQAIGGMRWQRRPTSKARCGLIRLRTYQRDAIFRDARRHRASVEWPEDDGRREVVGRAAAMLDKADESWLADWLLRAKPGALAEVAAGVSVHALLRCLPDVWDTLMEAGIADYPKASDWYDDIRVAFEWSPSAEQLYA